MRLPSKFIAVAASVLVLGMAACSKSTDTPTPSGSASSGGDQQAAAATEVETLLAGKVDFPKPTASVTPGSHKIAVVAAGLASPGPSLAAKNVVEGIAKIGWTADAPGDGKFTPTTQAQLIGKAVLDKVDGIVLIAITPAAVAASVKAAQDANIPIVCILCGDVPSGMVSVSNDPVAAGKAQAAYAVAKTKPGATIVVYQNTEFDASKQQSAAAAARVKELCPSCTVETPSLLLGEAVQPNAPIFVNLLNSHPTGKLDAVISPFDSPAGALTNTAAQLARTDISVIGHGGLAPFINMVGTGTPAMAKADVLISTPYFGWSAVDEMARLLAKAPTWNAAQMPVQLVTKDNFSKFPSDDVNAQPGFDFRAAFAKLWGK